MKPKYEIRVGFNAPTPGHPNRVYEVWRRKTLFRAEQHVGTFADRAEAVRERDLLNDVYRRD